MLENTKIIASPVAKQCPPVDASFEALLRKRVGDENFQKHFRDIGFRLGPEGVQIVAAEPRDLRRLQTRYLALIEQCAAEAQLQGQLSLRSAIAQDAGSQSRPAERSEVQSLQVLPFYPAPENAALLERIRQSPPPLLVVCGQTGAGKSALLQRFVDESLASGQPARRLSLERFLAEFAEACGRRSTIAWRTQLRRHRLLALDDLHFLKTQAARTQEELIHLIDHYAEGGGALLLSSDRALQELTLNESLRSRLDCAAVLTLYPPAEKDRRAIVEAEAARLGVVLDAGIIELFARRISRDMRRLKSAVALVALHSGQHQPGLAEVSELCAALLDPPLSIQPQEMLAAVAAAFRVSPDAMLGAGRDRRISEVRHIAAYLLNSKLGLNLKQTAACLGWREHGSVIHARRKVEARLSQDLFLQRQLAEICARLP